MSASGLPIFMVKIINVILLGILTVVSVSCGEFFKQDEYHKLSSAQHFAFTGDRETILSHNGKKDTLVLIGLLKAQYEVELYMGIHCKGPYDYREFERVYFALKQDTACIRNKKDIRSAHDYYGYCRQEIPVSEESIQFSYGYPPNTGIKNSPTLTLLQGRDYNCTTSLNSFSINKVKYTDVFKFQMDSLNFRTFGRLKNIYMTTNDGIIKIETWNNGDWIKTN